MNLSYSIKFDNIKMKVKDNTRRLKVEKGIYKEIKDMCVR